MANFPIGLGCRRDTPDLDVVKLEFWRVQGLKHFLDGQNYRLPKLNRSRLEKGAA